MVEQFIVHPHDSDIYVGIDLGESIRYTKVLAVRPDKNVLGLLEVDGEELGAVLGGVAEVAVGEGEPGQVPLRCETWNIWSHMSFSYLLTEK